MNLSIVVLFFLLPIKAFFGIFLLYLNEGRFEERIITVCQVKKFIH